MGHLGWKFSIHKLSTAVTDAGVEEREVALDERSTAGLSNIVSAGFGSRERTEVGALAGQCRLCPQIR